MLKSDKGYLEKKEIIHSMADEWMLKHKSAETNI